LIDWHIKSSSSEEESSEEESSDEDEKAAKGKVNTAPQSANHLNYHH